MTLPSGDELPCSGLIQWARGDVALRRRAPLYCGVLRVARGGSGAKAPPLAAHPDDVLFDQNQGSGL